MAGGRIFPMFSQRGPHLWGKRSDGSVPPPNACLAERAHTHVHEVTLVIGQGLNLDDHSISHSTYTICSEGRLSAVANGEATIQSYIWCSEAEEDFVSSWREGGYYSCVIRVKRKIEVGEKILRAVVEPYRTHRLPQCLGGIRRAGQRLQGGRFLVSGEVGT